MNPWKKLRTRKHTGNDHWEYFIDDFVINDQQEREYHYVHTEGSTMIIPLLPGNKIVLVNQYRYLNQKFGMEFPCGAIIKGLTPEENAIKELREETGYNAAKIFKIGEFTPYTGAADEVCHLFCARDLFSSPLPPDDTEEMEIVTVSLTELDKLISTNQIWDGLTLAAWSLSQSYLRSVQNV